MKMINTRYYEVARHRFCVSGTDDTFALMANYEPFACADGEPVFALTVEGGTAPAYTEELRQEEEGQVIICGHTADGEPARCRQTGLTLHRMALKTRFVLSTGMAIPMITLMIRTHNIR